jgi:hypothetical protein
MPQATSTLTADHTNAVRPAGVRSKAALALMALLGSALVSGCGPDAPSNSATAQTASDLEGHRYVDIDKGVELTIESDDSLVFSRWDSDRRSPLPFEFKGRHLVIDTTEGGANPQNITLSKTTDGGWQGNIDSLTMVTLVPVTDEVEAKVREAKQAGQERQASIAGRPASDDDYYPLVTEDDWRWLYVSRQKGWTDDEIADFLIPGHYQQKDAFKKRELFAQLSAVKAELPIWAARTDFVVEKDQLGDALWSLNAPYDFASSTFAFNAPMCFDRAYSVRGVPYRFLPWDKANCLVQVEEAKAQRIEPLRADKKVRVAGKVYLRALEIGADNAIELVAHKVVLTIQHRPHYAMSADQMEILDTVTATNSAAD